MVEPAVDEELTPPQGAEGWLDTSCSGETVSMEARAHGVSWADGHRQLRSGHFTHPSKRPWDAEAGSVYWRARLSLLSKTPNLQEATARQSYTMGLQDPWLRKPDQCWSGKTPIPRPDTQTSPLGTQVWVRRLLANIDRLVPASADASSRYQRAIFK